MNRETITSTDKTVRITIEISSAVVKEGIKISVEHVDDGRCTKCDKRERNCTCYELRLPDLANMH